MARIISLALVALLCALFSLMACDDGEADGDGDGDSDTDTDADTDGDADVNHCRDYCAIMYECGDTNWHIPQDCVEDCQSMDEATQEAYGVCHVEYGCPADFSEADKDQWDADIGLCMCTVMCEAETGCDPEVECT